jgi:MFS family permease
MISVPVPESGSVRHRYRFVVLAVFMFVNLTIQILWASYATITGVAARFHGVSDLQIGLLGMVFMIAFVPLSFPASWAIDRFGFRAIVGLGSVLMSCFGLLRGLAGQSYPLVLIGSIGIAAAQPLLLNAWTTVPARWFPHEERATAVGLVTFANLVGTGIGFALTPVLIEVLPIPTVQLLYGGVATLSAVLFLLFAREAPGAGEPEGRALVVEGLRHALKIPSFRIYLAVSFVGMGVFNGLATWVEPIIRPRGFTPEQAGILGAVMLAGGILGALVFPPISDRLRLRRPFIVGGLALAVPGVLGLAYATTLAGLVASVFALGFFLVATLPIGMQYSTEVTRPTPEGTSNGLIQLFGQISVVYVYAMQALRHSDGTYTRSLLLSAALLAASALLTARLAEGGRDLPRGSA